MIGVYFQFSGFVGWCDLTAGLGVGSCSVNDVECCSSLFIGDSESHSASDKGNYLI